MSHKLKSDEPKLRRKVGRQSTYTPERGKRVCVAISNGQSLRDALKAEGIWSGTWYDWIGKHPELDGMYTRARQALGDLLGHDVVATARTATPENANAVRILVDSLKWAACKMAPKQYSDRVELAGSREEPLRVQVEVIGGPSTTPKG